MCGSTEGRGRPSSWSTREALVDRIQVEEEEEKELDSVMNPSVDAESDLSVKGLTLCLQIKLKILR